MRRSLDYFFDDRDIYTETNRLWWTFCSHFTDQRFYFYYTIVHFTEKHYEISDYFLNTLRVVYLFFDNVLLNQRYIFMLYYFAKAQIFCTFAMKEMKSLIMHSYHNTPSFPFWHCSQRVVSPALHLFKPSSCKIMMWP